MPALLSLSVVSHELQGGILGSSIGDAAQKENEQWLGKIKTLRVARLHPIFFSSNPFWAMPRVLYQDFRTSWESKCQCLHVQGEGGRLNWGSGLGC